MRLLFFIFVFLLSKNCFSQRSEEQIKQDIKDVIVHNTPKNYIMHVEWGDSMNQELMNLWIGIDNEKYKRYLVLIKDAIVEGKVISQEVKIIKILDIETISVCEEGDFYNKVTFEMKKGGGLFVGLNDMKIGGYQLFRYPSTYLIFNKGTKHNLLLQDLFVQLLSLWTVEMNY